MSLTLKTTYIVTCDKFDDDDDHDFSTRDKFNFIRYIGYIYAPPKALYRNFNRIFPILPVCCFLNIQFSGNSYFLEIL